MVQFSFFNVCHKWDNDATEKDFYPLFSGIGCIYIGECLIMDDDAFSEMQQMRKYHRINK